MPALILAILISTGVSDEPSVPVSTEVKILWIGGATSIVAGVVFGVKALVHHRNASDVDFVGSQVEAEATHTSGLIANIAYGLGGASLIVGMVWHWWDSTHTTPSPVVPVVSPGGAGLLLRF